MNVKPYLKAIVAVGAAVGVAVSGAGDGVFDANDAIQSALAFAGAYGVYKVRNRQA